MEASLFQWQGSLLAIRRFQATVPGSSAGLISVLISAGRGERIVTNDGGP
jgi:hypothetical protein